MGLQNMKKDRTRKQWRMKSVTAVFFLLMLWAVPVFAGDINAAEQTIIDYYNQTFVYGGKTYVASESAKAAVYQKLAADDTDLTESQARAAIRQASKNIKKGIADGYLMEVSSEDEKNTEDILNTEDVSGAGNVDDPADVTDMELEPDVKTQGTQDTGEIQEVGENQRKPEDNISPKQEKPIPFDSETENDMEEKKPVKVDVQKLLADVRQEGAKYSTVQAGEASSVTVEQYLEGKLTAVSRDGTLLFEGGLPLKNTGYNTGSFTILAVISGVLFLFVLLAGLSCIHKERKHKK